MVCCAFCESFQCRGQFRFHIVAPLYEKHFWPFADFRMGISKSDLALRNSLLHVSESHTVLVLTCFLWLWKLTWHLTLQRVPFKAKRICTSMCISDKERSGIAWKSKYKSIAVKDRQAYFELGRFKTVPSTLAINATNVSTFSLLEMARERHIIRSIFDNLNRQKAS